MKKLFVHDMVQNNPGLEKYKSKYNMPVFLKQRGYDGKVFDLFECAQFAIEWKLLNAAHPEREPVFLASSRELEWVKRKKQELKKEYLGMKENGIQVFFMMDIIVLPNRLKKLYPEIMNEKGEIDILKPEMKEILYYLFAEMFDTFPEIDGVYIRYGETYVGEKYSTPYHCGNNPILYPETSYHLFLMEFLRDIICSKYGKSVFYRTWGFGKFQYDPDFYLTISNMLEPHPLFYFCIKHTQGDFHRLFPFNQCLNKGNHHQVVEVQAAREYEGKGAYPDYIAGGVINGFEELNWIMRGNEKKCLTELFESEESLIDGIWIWSRGGGWGGPYINKNIDEKGKTVAEKGCELWPDINSYVLSHWAKDMSRSDQFYVMEYAKSVLDMHEKDAEKLYQILQLSAHAVLLGRGTTIQGIEWDVFWTRDQNISYDLIMKNVKSAENAGKLSLLVEEKANSVKVWSQIVNISENISKKGYFTDYIITTCKYGYFLYAIYETIYRGNAKMLMGDKCAVKNALIEYDALWNEWENLYENSIGCPTLFAKEDKILDMGGYCTNTGLDGAMNPLRKFIDKKPYTRFADL